MSALKHRKLTGPAVLALVVGYTVGVIDNLLNRQLRGVRRGFLSK